MRKKKSSASVYRLSNDHLEKNSFYWEGGSIGVLLMHGLTATTSEVRLLAEKLQKEGYAIAAPLLPGHGTSPADLNRVRWQEWVQRAEEDYHKLATLCDYVFVGGESTGGVAALHMAAQRPDIAGVLCYAPALKLQLNAAEKAGMALGSHLRVTIPKASANDNPYWQGYDVMPLHGAMELRRMNKATLARLKQIRQPVLIVQGRHDSRVAPECGEIIIGGVSSSITELYWMEESGHVLLVEDELETIAALTVRFIERTLGERGEE